MIAAPISLSRRAELRETLPLLIFGLPFGEALAEKDTYPSATIAQGTVASIRRDAEGAVHRVQIDGGINPGNSGGPVLDGAGRLIGVAV